MPFGKYLFVKNIPVIHPGALRFAHALVVPIVAGLLLMTTSGAIAAEEPATDGKFAQDIVPFLSNHCTSCHGGDAPEGDIALDRYQQSANVQQDYELWEKISRLINDHQMPPADEEQPTSDEVIAVTAAIERELASFDCSAQKRPGRVTIQRLNKAEYNNTIRDLTGLDLRIADSFPADDVGNGFDNIGDVLSIPPILLEKYLEAAETIADRVYEDTAARRRVLPHTGESEEEKIAAARRNVNEFATRAFRRPLTDEEAERLFAIMRSAWQREASESTIFKTAIAAILSNPNFLFRVEQGRGPEVADDAADIRALDGYELASRLSYFLWSSMPDERLFKLAANGELTKPSVLAEEAKRMLADPKSIALIENFAGQWLQLRDVSRLMPDPNKFPDFDGELRTAMRRETELFFETMIREDRSVLEFLNADFTYVNERLARHYGLAEVTGEEFRRVPLGQGRRGVLTHASILLLTSNPTRTSPVKRGKWILENMLAEPPPPPPANVPELEEGAETLGTLREQMEQHRSNPTCASCHRTMDALGFGLENFDAIGAWRDSDGQAPIDASGELPGGRQFDGASDLMKILVEEKQDQFLKCLTEKLLVYGLGRGLNSFDRCTIKDCVAALKDEEFRFSALVIAIVTSDPFTLREVN
ncbi:MAG: DUF1592 domain-containing protein [Pirellulaceae bacterium]